MGHGYRRAKILWDFVSQCEVWHVWTRVDFDRYSENDGYASFQWNKLFNLFENGFFCLF